MDACFKFQVIFILDIIQLLFVLRERTISISRASNLTGVDCKKNSEIFRERFKKIYLTLIFKFFLKNSFHSEIN